MMAFNRTLMVIAVLLLASLLAEGDAQQKVVDQKEPADVKPVRPETHGGGWSGSGGGWGGWGPWGGGGWGGGGRGGGWGGGGHGGGWGGGGWGGGGRGGGGGWGGGGWGGGGCGYRCGHHCCTPQEVAKIKKIEEMNMEGRMTAEVKPETAVGTEGYGGGGWGGGGWGGGGGGHGGWGGGGWGGGGGRCHYWCGRHCCGSPEEMASFKRDVELATEANNVKPQEMARLAGRKETVGAQGYGGGAGGWGGGSGGWGGSGGGGGGGGRCHRWCGRHCCTPEEIANNPELNRAESEAKGTETKTVKQGEVKN